MTERDHNITLRAGTLPSEAQTVMSVPAPSAETPVVSVASSHQGAYRVCKRMTDFFYTVRTELWLAAQILRSGFRFFRSRKRMLAPAVCCGYSRTILGWRL